MKSKKWKLIDILNLSTNYLAEKQIENPRLNAELIIAHVLQLTRVQLYLHFDRPLNENELSQVRSLLQRRVKHEPIQYIIGETEFYSLKFKVNRYTLIPRPETEILVERIIAECRERNSIKILDVGAGCGNISIALAKNLVQASILGIDVQKKAVEIAEENARQLKVNQQVEFRVADVFNSDFTTIISERFDVVVSNPPYIAQDEFAALPEDVKNYEPYIALNGGKDGLLFYRRLFQLGKRLLTENGLIGVEIGYKQGEALKEMAMKYGAQKVEVVKDLNGLERVVFVFF